MLPRATLTIETSSRVMNPAARRTLSAFQRSGSARYSACPGGAGRTEEATDVVAPITDVVVMAISFTNLIACAIGFCAPRLRVAPLRCLVFTPGALGRGPPPHARARAANGGTKQLARMLSEFVIRRRRRESETRGNIRP